MEIPCSEVLAVNVLLGGFSATTQYLTHTFQYHASLDGMLGNLVDTLIINEAKWEVA